MPGPYPSDQGQAAGAIPVYVTLGPDGVANAPFAFQQAVTETAEPLTANASTAGFSVVALPGNTATVYVGPSGVTTANGYPLSAGQSVRFAVANTDLIYVVSGSTGQSVAVTGN
jgi:hypothetical protein